MSLRLSRSEIDMTTLKELRKKHGIEAHVAGGDIDEKSGLTFADRARLAAQGGLFNFSDEGIALFRSLIGEDYETALADERAELEAARGKEGSLKYEIGGAIIPALAAAPFTGGTSIPLTVARLAALGGTQALAAGIGAREGDIVERVTQDPLMLGAETVAGTVAGPVLGKGIKYGGKAIKALAKPGRAASRALSGRLSIPVENEVRRLARDAYGIDVPEDIAFARVVERIGKGEIFPDISEQAAKDVAALYNISGKGGQVIANIINRRADDLPTQARATMQADLVPNFSETNITKWFGKKISDIKKAESASYNKIFAAGDDLPPESWWNLNLGVREVLQNQKFLRNKVNALMAAKNKPPLFKIVDGQVRLLDDVDLETAEIVRRALKDKSSKAWRDGEGSLGEAIGNLEDDLRKVIDTASPELSTTRAGWAKVLKLAEVFEEGKKILNKSSEEAEILMDGILASGDDELIGALRSGVAFRLKTQAEKAAGRAAQIRTLADEKSGMRIILERLYPGDSVEVAFGKIELANKALTTKVRVKGGPQTAERLAAAERIGTAQDAVADVADMAITGNVFGPATRFAKRVLGKKSKLNPKQLGQIAKIIVTEDPEVIEKALNNPEMLQILINRVNQAANLVQRAGTGAGAYEAGEVTRESSSVNAIINSLSPSARDKVKRGAN
jgi:hypothetical protein